MSRWAVVWLAAAACGSPSDRFIATPGGAGTILEARVVSGAVAVVVHDASLPVRLSASAGGDQLLLLVYPDPPAALGLEAGPFEVDRCNRICAIARPSAAYELRDSLIETTAPPEILRALVPDFAERCERCVALDQTFVPIPIEGLILVRFATRMADGSVLVGVRTFTAGFVLRVDPDLTVTVVCKNTPIYEDGLIAGPGRLWVSESIPPRLSELDLEDRDLEGTCRVRTSTTAPLGDIHKIAGGPVGSGVEIVAISSEGAVVRYDGRAFQALGSVELTGPSRGSLVWSGPGRAAAFGDLGAMIRTEGQEVSSDHVPLPTPLVRIRAACAHESLGIVLAVTEEPAPVNPSEGLMVKRGESWSMTSVPGLGAPAGLVPFADGVIFTSDGGTYRQIFPSEDVVCDRRPGFTHERVFDLAALGDDGLLLGDITTHDAQPNAFGVLRPPPSSCR